MSLKLNPLHPLFAAEASGVDITKPLSPQMVDAIDDAMNRYAVLVFRGQPLSQDEQMAFTLSFGPLDLGFKKASNQHARLKYKELADISNVAEDGEIAERSHRRIVNNMANQLWHSDSSFQNPPARYSMLHSVVNPSSGGETEFADLRAAYDGLDAGLLAEIEGLEAEHFALHSRFMLGDTDYTQQQIDAIPRVRWPLIRTHPGSGRKLLFVGVHASHIEGLPVAEGRVLLSDLLEHATQPAYVYRHRWQVGDLVIWDNRCTVHRGRRYDLSQRRELRRSTTLDVDRADVHALASEASVVY
ncbi:TauD/TfdA family dioxygenase [Paralcaligenes sp. KSB-10]|uniref:TauD/TfdA dioxygenase family protein n=1 Tax=Paralcaligenes sp. KSB-10 TaxID=2901142 RepID=UPI001E56DE9A|nr:TauD/TfdA family dioxygenase [Paralcaligenes sp. KSB-10]UHL62732.1 TauD/TfdA family dioxygenase [Paralcaligenes sp. KSB-10]